MTKKKQAETENIEPAEPLPNIDEKQTKIDELTDTLQRLQADFENYKKRADKEKAQFAKFANQKLILELLTILDSFELAMKNIHGNSSDPSKDFEKLKKGFELIYAQFHSILEHEGLRQIQAVGKRFDPYLHDALMQTESEQDEIVLEEFQKGYMLHDGVLRHSKVRIAKKREAKAQEAQDNHEAN